MERRNSTNSDSSTDSSLQRQYYRWKNVTMGSTARRHSSCDNAETPLGRVAKVTTPKPPPNALQFVKTGPADLYRSAQEQLKKVEEIKKAKKHVPEEIEDWQSNLDNWKFSRRKRQEHIIERVVEVKKLELEEHERNRRRSKTFSEMIQDRNTRGRKTSLPVYEDEDPKDLFKNGIENVQEDPTEGNDFTSDEVLDDSRTKFKNREEELEEEEERWENQERRKDTTSSSTSSTTVNGVNSFKNTESKNEVEEYTYERAIQSYVNFAETRVKSRSARNLSEDSKVQANGFVVEPPAVPVKPRRSSTPKTENVTSHNEQRKSVSGTEFVNEVNKKLPELPKVDISKRKELFEKVNHCEDTSVKPNRTSSDLTNGKSIKERLSSLKEFSESTKPPETNKVSVDISVKERLTGIQNIERFNSIEEKQPSNWRTSNQNPPLSIKDRLSNIEKSKNPSTKLNPPVETTASIKERLSSLRSSVSREQSEEVFANSKQNNYEELVGKQEESYEIERENCERSFSPEEIFDNKRQQHYRHRSLDSLDIDSNSNDTFDRVQSLEDLDYCRNYPASTFSGDTDREDSGIHTADVSSSVSQADDYDLHLETNGVLDDIKAHHQPTIIEEIKHCKRDSSPNSSFLYEEASHAQDVSRTPPDCEVDIHSSPSNFSSQAGSILLSPSSQSEQIFKTNSSNIADTTASLDLSPLNTSNHNKELDHCPLEPINFENAVIKDEGGGFLTNLPSDISSNVPVEKDQVRGNTSSEESVKRRETTSCINPEHRRTVVEVCCKMDSTDIKSPPVTPFISVDFPIPQINEKSEITIMNDSCNDSSDMENTYVKAETLEQNSCKLIANGGQFEKDDLNQNKGFMENETRITKEPYLHLGKKIMEEPHLANNDLIVNSVGHQLVIPVDNLKMGELFFNYNMEQEVENVFQLSPTTLEPPKEKPPPPPTDVSDDEIERKNSVKSTSLRRLDSTKRIKKEIRQKRSSFLGIEGCNDDSYLDPELELIRPPDMTTLLAEERRMERQLYRQSICSESDSNQESRDSGVELDNKNLDIGWSHSRNDSETFGNQSTTSEEDEIMRKEREIIETLEQEERIRKQDLGEKLALRLRQLEVEKGREDWERINQEEALRNHHNLHRPIQEHSQHTNPYQQKPDTVQTNGNCESFHQEHLVKELYPCEQERLPNELHMRETVMVQQQWCNSRGSLQDISHNNQVYQEKVQSPDFQKEYRNSLQDLTTPGRGRHTVSHGRSMPDLHQVIPRRPPPPPPVLPAKPRPSQQVSNESQTCPQQMTRQTLQALSAAPRSRLISNDTWQAKRKPRQDSYNYHHWLIQEAEHRRITELQHRQNMNPQRPCPPKPVASQWNQAPPLPYNSHSHHTVYTTVPPTQRQWSGHQRDSKHLPDSIIQTLTQRVQNRINAADTNNNRRRYENHSTHENQQEKMLSVSGKKRCSHCGEELGRGAAMIIESLRLFYHIECFKCCVCCMQLGDGLMGTDVRVRNNKLHCHNCYSSDDGVKFSCV